MNTLKNFGKQLVAGVSRAAESLGFDPKSLIKNPTWKVTGHCGKRGAAYRRIIGYKKTGPFYEQTGLLPNGKPKMTRSYYHTFQHATKGFRFKRTFNPTVVLSNAIERRVYGPRAQGYQSTHGWVNPSRGGTILVPYFRLDKTKANARGGMHKMPRPYTKRPRHHADARAA